MEKLPHERLREIVDNISKENSLYSSWTIDVMRKRMNIKASNSYGEDLQNIIRYIADEIEKYYDPKPRDHEGEPCNEGDTLYRVTDGSKYTVAMLGYNIPGDIHEMVLRDEEGCLSRANGKFYTHREPDSLEKLRDDLRDLVPFIPADELTVNTSDLISITNRLTAIMERDA